MSDLDGIVNEDVSDSLTLEQRALQTAAIQLLTAWIEGSEKIRAAISSDDAGYIDEPVRNFVCEAYHGTKEPVCRARRR